MLLRAEKDADPRTAACQVADVVLLAMFTQHATAALIEPRGGGTAEILIERARQVLGRAVIEDALGEAVAARFGLLCDLDPAREESQLGRTTVRVGEVAYEILVTLWRSRAGMRCELRLLDEKGRYARAVAREPAGREYPAVLAEGTRVGPYQVLEVLGKGGMGVVYRVEHRNLQKRFAMKVLLRDVFERDAEAAARFVCEARAAARIQHPGIVNVSDFGSLADGRAFLVMELLAGQSVDRLLKKHGPFEPRRALALAASAAEALDAAHEAGVIHRDLTPSNIFVDRSGGRERAKLVDFGAAKMTSQTDVDFAGPARLVFGTPYYMAPEHAQGQPTDPRSDVYSLGCCLHEMLTGQPPFYAATVREILLAHILDPPPRPESPHGELPARLEALLARMMAKHPRDRHGSAAEVAAELEGCLEELRGAR